MGWRLYRALLRRLTPLCVTLSFVHGACFLLAGGVLSPQLRHQLTHTAAPLLGCAGALTDLRFLWVSAELPCPGPEAQIATLAAW